MTVEEYPFSELLSVVIDNRGKTCPTADSGIPLIATNCIRNEQLYPTYDKVRFVSHETHSNWFRGHPLPGDIIFVNKATPGRVCLVPDPVDFCIAQDMVAVRANPKRVYPNYLFAVLRSPAVQEKISQMHVGTLIPHFKKGDFDKLLLPVPERNIQEFIGDTYFTLSAKIELNRRMNATLEAMAQALFQSWFVDFDPVRAKLDGRKPVGMDEATAALFPEHLENSPIGKKPVGWEVTVLENVLAVLETGGRPKGGVGGIKSGIPSIGAESIINVGVFDFSKTKFVPVEFYEGMKKGHIESHDVLLYKDGGRPGEYEPHVSMFGDGFPFEECCINEHVYRLRANQSLSQEYLYFWMTSEFAFAEMRIKGTGVAIPGLNSTAVRSLAVLVPPPPIVEAFTKQAAPLVTRILANAKQSRTLATLRDTMLPKLLSGEISTSIQELNQSL
jgi:type I restriction enzyme S subunit